MALGEQVRALAVEHGVLRGQKRQPGDLTLAAALGPELHEQLTFSCDLAFGLPLLLALGALAAVEALLGLQQGLALERRALHYPFAVVCCRMVAFIR